MHVEKNEKIQKPAFMLFVKRVLSHYILVS